MTDDAVGFTSWDVAKRLGVTPERVRQLAREGVLRVMLRTPGGTRIFDAKVVEALRRERARARRQE